LKQFETSALLCVVKGQTVRHRTQFVTCPGASRKLVIFITH